MTRYRYRHYRRRDHQRGRRRNPGVRYRSGYSHGTSVARMYRKLERHGVQALNRRELKLLRRERDEDPRQNPRGHRGHRKKSRRRGSRGLFRKADAANRRANELMERYHPRTGKRGYRSRRKYFEQAYQMKASFGRMVYQGRANRNPRFVAPQSLRGSALRYNWERQMARRAERDAVTARYQRPTRVYIPDKESRWARNPFRDHIGPRRRHHARHNRRVKIMARLNRKSAALAQRFWGGRKDRRHNPKRDGRPTKGERRRSRRAHGRFDYEPDYSSYVKRPGRRNPARRRRNPLGCRMSKESMFHELKHHGSRYRPQKQRVAIVLSTLRKCGRRNPKRDGTPTRGEMRTAKKSTYLKTIMQRGKDAEAILARIHAVPAKSAAAVKEHLPQAAVAVMDAPPAKIEAAVEHAEAKFLRSRIDELSILHADLMSQIAELGDDDVAADDAARLQEQAAKLGKQRGLLKAKAQSLGIMTNPRPRGHSRRVLVGLRAYGVALKRLHSAIRAR